LTSGAAASIADALFQIARRDGFSSWAKLKARVEAITAGQTEVGGLLLDLGADVNARATVDSAGIGGQTAIFHAVTQREDAGLPIARVLLQQGADLSVRVKVPGHYERPAKFSSARHSGTRSASKTCHMARTRSRR
jgi:hypothetical protein